MSHRSFILTSVLLLVLVGGAVGVYAYDSSRKDTIAEGVTVAGIDVGGMSAGEARTKLRRDLAAPLEKPVAVTHGKRRFTLSPRDAGIHADLGGMVDEAVAASRKGNVVTRAYRDISGGEEYAAVPARVSYSKIAAQRLVERVRRGLDRPARDASLKFPSLAEVRERDGVRVDTAALTRRIRTAMLSPSAREMAAPTKVTKAKVTRAQLARRYPVVLVVDRANFKLRIYKHLELAKAYTVAIGAVGYATPAGLYHIQNKGVNVPWSVPKAAWAGSLAGQVIPGGAPNNPLKARWLGIFAGAGIHGTDSVGSLGSAASHGCVRMAIPDVIELYSQVPVQAPIYIA